MSDFEQTAHRGGSSLFVTPSSHLHLFDALITVCCTLKVFTATVSVVQKFTNTFSYHWISFYLRKKW